MFTMTIITVVISICLLKKRVHCRPRPRELCDRGRLWLGLGTGYFLVAVT